MKNLINLQHGWLIFKSCFYFIFHFIVYFIGYILALTVNVILALVNILFLASVLMAYPLILVWGIVKILSSYCRLSLIFKNPYYISIIDGFNPEVQYFKDKYLSFKSPPQEDSFILFSKKDPSSLLSRKEYFFKVFTLPVTIGYLLLNTLFSLLAKLVYSPMVIFKESYKSTKAYYLPIREKHNLKRRLADEESKLLSSSTGSSITIRQTDLTNPHHGNFIKVVSGGRLCKGKLGAPPPHI
jgi:hypothetical protein